MMEINGAGINSQSIGPICFCFFVVLSLLPFLLIYKFLKWTSSILSGKYPSISGAVKVIDGTKEKEKGKKLDLTMCLVINRKSRNEVPITIVCQAHCNKRELKKKKKLVI